MITSLAGIHQPISFTQHAEVGLRGLLAHLELFAIDMDPAYQRSHVWTVDQQEALVGHLLEGGTIPPIICNEIMDPVFTSHIQKIEVVDGKQRLTAMLRWLSDEIPGALTDGREVWFKDLDRTSRTILSTDVRIAFRHTRLDEAGVLRLYLKLNRGGTVHTEAEIKRVRDLLAQVEGPPVMQTLKPEDDFWCPECGLWSYDQSFWQHHTRDHSVQGPSTDSESSPG